MTTVYFVRHAQTDYSNPIDKDRPLTAEGMQDRYLARDYMVKQGVIGQLTHVYASNFRRAADTVRPIAEAAGLPVEEKEEFREWTLLAKGEEYYSISQRAWEDFTYRYETCETLQEVQTRNLRKLRELVAEHPDETIVIGTHGTALPTFIFQPPFIHNGKKRSIENNALHICCNYVSVVNNIWFHSSLLYIKRLAL